MNIEVRFKKLHIWAFISKNTQIRTILSTILIDIWDKNRYNELGKLISRGCKQIYLQFLHILLKEKEAVIWLRKVYFIM